MPRKTDSNNPADWLRRPLCESLAERYFADRYPGFDVEDEDWPTVRRQAEEIERLIGIVKSRVSTLPRSSG